MYTLDLIKARKIYDMKLLLTGIALVVVIFFAIQFNSKDTVEPDGAQKHTAASKETATSTTKNSSSPTDPSKPASPIKSSAKTKTASYPPICIEENEKIKVLTHNELDEMIKSKHGAPIVKNADSRKKS